MHTSTQQQGQAQQGTPRGMRQRPQGVPCGVGTDGVGRGGNPRAVTRGSGQGVGPVSAWKHTIPHGGR